MSIFNFNKNSVSLSGDWQLFQKFMGNIGAFTYIAKEKSAYMDSVTCKLLNCSHEKINEYEFFNLLDKISKNPVDGYKHVLPFPVIQQTAFSGTPALYSKSTILMALLGVLDEGSSTTAFPVTSIGASLCAASSQG